MFAIILSYSYYHFFAILKVIQSLYINSTQYFIALIFKVILEIKQEYFKKKNLTADVFHSVINFLIKYIFRFACRLGYSFVWEAKGLTTIQYIVALSSLFWYQICSFILFEKNVKIVHFETIPMKKCLIDFYYVRERLATEQFVLNFRGLGSSIKKQLILIQSSIWV